MNTSNQKINLSPHQLFFTLLSGADYGLLKLYCHRYKLIRVQYGGCTLVPIY